MLERPTLPARARAPVPAPVTALAAELAARAGEATAAVLFYGSALRDGALDGVLDFYVLTDRPIVWPGSRLTSLAGRLLPPNVGYLETVIGGTTLRTKYAVMTLAQFRRAMSAESIDTTLWARFSQPVACVRARGDGRGAGGARGDRRCRGHRRALGRGARAGARRGDRLLARPLPAHLRRRAPGRARRPCRRPGGARRRTATCVSCREAWRAGGLAFAAGDDGLLTPALSASERAAAERRWRLRRHLGRPLNLLRLLKAASTFDNAADYVAWKIERHSGYRIEPSEFQRRHPVLAAPALYLKLRARGVLR